MCGDGVASFFGGCGPDSRLAEDLGATVSFFASTTPSAYESLSDLLRINLTMSELTVIPGALCKFSSLSLFLSFLI